MEQFMTGPDAYFMTAMGERAQILLQTLAESERPGLAKVGHAYSTIPKPSYRELLDLGYVRKFGNNGHGRVRISARGILKAITLGLIEHHPQEFDSMGGRWLALQEEHRLVERWGPGR